MSKYATHLFWLTVLGLFPAFLFSQTPAIKLKLQLMPDGQTWGVYAMPELNTYPSINTITGTAQVTVVMPKDYDWNSFTSVSGTWFANAIVNGPSENPTRKYISFGLLTDFPHINYIAGEETLLFTFKKVGSCPDSMYIIGNTDPFYPPNSVNSFPNNEVSIFDLTTLETYSYSDNYAPAAWNCHDNDGDGILNAHEDTNGNGTFDPSDASDLNNADFPSANGGIEYKLQLLPDGEFWGVYARPAAGTNPSMNTITGTAQVTVVMPKDYDWNSFTSVSGTWAPNATVNGPTTNPTKKYVSVGLLMDFPHINYVAGQETMLFKFRRNQACPDSLYLIDCNTDPICNSQNNSNPGNEASIFDPASLSTLSYVGNYALSAWNCHDNDGDGILNALEDTNGNGVYDPGTDASDLNEGDPAQLPGCVKLKLQLLPDSSGWAVQARAFGGYQPSANAVATTGRVTIAMPLSMPFGSVQDVHGDWALTSTVTGPQQNPTRRYRTFEMLPNATGLGLSATDATTLFTFDKLGNCPDSLYIMDAFVPTGLQPNAFGGYDPNSFTNTGFEYCGTYAPKAWRCKKTPPIIVLPPSAPDSLITDGPGSSSRSAPGFAGGEPEIDGWFTATPNPTAGSLTVTFPKGLVGKDFADGKNTLTLHDAQGRQRRSVRVEGVSVQLDLRDLPAGLYLLTVSQNGRVVQRERIVKL